MPRLTDETMQAHTIGGTFNFAGTRIERLGATEYTLVTIAEDETGSVSGFETELKKARITAVEACKKSPRSDHLLLRVVTFSSRFPNGVEEVHGFKPLAEINPATDYPDLRPGGGTPLCDACYSAIGAMNVYGKELTNQDFSVNGITFIITDGEENASTATMKMVQEETAKSVTGEVLESMVTVLIGINTGMCKPALERFQREAGLTQFVDVGDATPRRLAKLAEFVSQSVSSQSMALGTGGPSQDIAATI